MILKILETCREQNMITNKQEKNQSNHKENIAAIYHLKIQEKKTGEFL